MSKARALHPAVRALANHVGEFMAYWGFKRVHGRIWTYLAVSREPLDANELIRRLRVSKALVSMTLSDLTRFRAILYAGKSERKTQLYKVNPEVMTVIFGVLMQREHRIVSKVESALGKVRALSEADCTACGISSRSVDEILTLTKAALRALDGLISMYQFDLTRVKTFKLGG